MVSLTVKIFVAPSGRLPLCSKRTRFWGEHQLLVMKDSDTLHCHCDFTVQLQRDLDFDAGGLQINEARTPL
jgi:hypothetical protein